MQPGKRHALEILTRIASSQSTISESTPRRRTRATPREVQQTRTSAKRRRQTRQMDGEGGGQGASRKADPLEATSKMDIMNANDKQPNLKTLVVSASALSRWAGRNWKVRAVELSRPVTPIAPPCVASQGRHVHLRGKRARSRRLGWFRRRTLVRVFVCVCIAVNLVNFVCERADINDSLSTIIYYTHGLTCRRNRNSCF